MSDTTRVITGVTRWAYVNVWEPKAPEEGKEAVFSLCLLIPKSDKVTVNAIKAATNAAIEEAISSKFGGRKPAPGSIRVPLRDGDIDRPDQPEFAGHYFINAKSKYQPQIIGLNRKQIIEKDEIYSGVYGVASLTLYAYDFKGNKGVTAQLNNLMKVRNGERLSGSGISAVDEFSGVVTEDYTEEDYAF